MRTNRRAGAGGPVVVPLACSLGVWLIVLAAVPGWAVLPAVLLAVAVTLAVLRGVGEETWVRVAFGARRLTAAEHAALAPALTVLCQAGIGPPRITVYAAAGRGVPARGAGRRSVVVDRGLVLAAARGTIPPGPMAVQMAHAAAGPLTGRTRCEAAIWAWTLPYRTVAAVVGWVGRCVPALAWAFGLGWRIRFVTFAVAVWQTWPVQPGGSLFLLTLLAASYYQPWATIRHSRSMRSAGDRFVVDHGLGPQLVAVLERAGEDRASFERLYAIRAQLPADQVSR